MCRIVSSLAEKDRVVFKSLGTIRYSPKAKSIPDTSKWWVVIDCCPELCRYYRELWNWEHRFGTIVLHKPAWAGHISVVADEKPPDDKLSVWQSHAGELIEFEYRPELQTNGQYFWLNVVCDAALDLRAELGLARNPFYPLHLTVGIDLAFNLRGRSDNATSDNDTM